MDSPRTFTLHPSMSRSDILANCSFPFEREYEHEPSSEPARYGSGFHELTADQLLHEFTWMHGKVRKRVDVVAAKWGLTLQATDELRGHVPEAYAILKDWLSGENPWQLNFLRGPRPIVERSLALRPGLSAKEIRPPTEEDHVYEDVRPGEVPGTTDLVIPPASTSTKHPRPLLVLDHKTGDEEDFSRPLEKEQLLSLAAAALRSPWARGARTAIVGALHARRRGLAKVYADKVTLKELAPHEEKLRVGLSRIGDGSMKPGPWCKWCPARDMCPAQASEVISRAGEVLVGLNAAGGLLSGGGKVTGLVVAPPEGVTRDQQLGALYEIVMQAEKLAPIIRERIRNEVIAGAIPELSNGRVLVIEDGERERLSKASVIEALGKVAGERMLNKLRRLGAIEKKPEKRLRVKEDY